MRLHALIWCFLPIVSGLKFLSYGTVFGRSHSTFMHSLHESLIDAGHEVHVISPIINTQLKLENTRAKMIFIPQSPEALIYEKVAENDMVTNSWVSTGMTSALEPLMRILAAWHGQCNATLHHPGLMELLERENYDAAFSEPICFCGFGLFAKLGIKNIATTLSTSGFGGFFRYTGAHTVPSYVPGVLSPFTDRMSFLQRVMNTIQSVMPYFVTPMLQDPYTDMFKKRFGEDFPTTEEILDRVSLHFLNAEPLTEFPQMTTHKIVEIGGISVAGGHNPLNENWSNVMNFRKRTVIISFGTIAQSYLMPIAYKQTLLRTIQKFPDVTFVWKYEKPEHNISMGIENLIESTWMPQNDMLNDSRLSLFITHCGQGSAIEATKAGVPLVVIPVLGDQERNAQVIKRIGTGIVLEKADLADGDLLEWAIREGLENEEYIRNAKSIGKMIRGRPFTPRETFVRNMEFMAEFGPLRLLDHYGTQLNFIQYYSLDVFAFLFTIILLPICGVVYCFTAVFVKIFRVTRVKSALRFILCSLQRHSKQDRDEESTTGLTLPFHES